MTDIGAHGPSALDPILSGAPHRVGIVSLVVADLDRVSDFYRRMLGLELLETSEGVARLGTASAVLLELRHDAGAAPRSARDAGLFHTAFLLPERADLGAWLAFGQGAGLQLQGAADHTVSEAVYLSDPEGNGIEVYVDRPPEAWPMADGTVQMANDRLDFSGLADMARARAWAGFPSGGTIGHVHLQVGDLAPAETFYRGVLGFDVTCRYTGATFYGSGGYHHQLAANIWNSRGAGPRPERATGLAEVELLVDPATLDAIAARASDAGGPDGRTLHDPWGTAIRLAAS